MQRRPTQGSAAGPVVVILLLLAGWTAAGCGRQRAPTGSSLLLLTVDTFRYDLLAQSPLDGLETPNLDRLRDCGTSFEQAISPMPRTTPALGSLLTGLWTAEHGSREVGDPMRRVATLASRLREHGWSTAAVSANLSASAKQRLDRGFDRFVGAEELTAEHGERLYRSLQEVGRADIVGWATATTDRALRIAETLHPKSPFFLWLFYFDPHFIYLPPPPHAESVEAEGCWQVYRHFDRERRLAGQLFSNVGGVAEAALEPCRRLYYAEIEYFDAEVGRLLAGLGERGLLEDTLLVFTADHGENFGEHGLFFEHGPNLHDAAIRVPLVFSGPRVAAGRRDRSSVSLVDVAPTILSLLGLDQEPPAMAGRDLTAHLRPSSAPAPDLERAVFAESAMSVWHEATGVLVTGWEGGRVCLHGKRFSLCRDGERRSGSLELFDHIADPGLTAPVAGEPPPEASRLAAALDRWSPATARQRVARTSRFKLLATPRLDGGWDSFLFEPAEDSKEEVDVKGLYPQVYRQLRSTLEQWLATQPEVEPGPPDRGVVEDLRSLGYLSD